MGIRFTSESYDSSKSSVSSKSKLSRLIKSKLTKSSECKDNFIIKHVQNNKEMNNSIDIESLDQRRVIFVSLLGLYQTWARVPSIILYNAIFLLPMKRQWIYKPSQYTQELQSHFISNLSIFQDSAERNEFIELLKWKDSQGLVIWMLHDYDKYKPVAANENLINPFWYFLSAKLTTLYDAINGQNYNPLNLNEKCLQNKKQFVSNSSSILSELYFLTMKFNSMQEILYQSNPNSLNPIKSYKGISDIVSDQSPNPNNNDVQFITSPDDIYIDDNENGDFVFSTDYDL